MIRYGLAAAFSPKMDTRESISGIRKAGPVQSAETPMFRFVRNVRIFTFGVGVCLSSAESVSAQPPGKLLGFLIQFGRLPIRRRSPVLILAAGSFLWVGMHYFVAWPICNALFRCAVSRQRILQRTQSRLPFCRQLTRP